MERINWIDMAKGGGIILVVIGHCLNPNSVINSVIFSFHMPLFFIISGYLLKSDVTISHFLYKKSVRLLLPYFFTFIIYFFAYTIIDNNSNAWQEYLINLSKSYALGNGLVYSWIDTQPVGPLWFIVCLFCAEIVFLCILNSTQNKYFQGGSDYMLCMWICN